MNDVIEFVEEVAGIYFRSVLILKSGVRVPQHVHPYDHATYCGQGSALMIVDGKIKRVVNAGEAVLVEANHSHEFEALEDNTRLACVHDAQSAEVAKEK